MTGTLLITGGSRGIGAATVDLAAVPQGCRVCNVFEHDIGVSEYVMAAMLYFTIGLVSKSERFRSGSWTDSPRVGAPFRPELAGRTVGLIGYGHIGRAVARRAKAFGLRVMALARTRRDLDPPPDWLGEPASCRRCSKPLTSWSSPVP